VIVPTALGWGFGAFFLPDQVWPVHMFLGAALCATSVGITARVLQDLGQSQRKESRIILGAAVIDDVLGLVVLALAAGVVNAMNSAASGGDSQFSLGMVGAIVVKALGFLLAALVLGQFISRPLFKVASFLRGRGLLIVSALAFCFLFAWAADQAGLATIVGAFAAGLVLEDTHYKELVEDEGDHHLESLLHPLVHLFVPIFFVEMGMHVDLRSLVDVKIVILASGLSAIAILGKLACSLGVLERGLNRLSVGIGMIPRGEVGLIFAAIGLRLHIGGEHILTESTYSALVVMVIATTIVTPPLLKWAFDRQQATDE
jgi:Kef-type K+ transport system membrane component KefB